MKDEHKPHDQNGRGASPVSLVMAILNHVGELVRKEVDLARAEINENIARAGFAIALIVVAIVLALTALDVLAAALVVALSEFGLGAGWSALIVGGVIALVAALLVMKALSDLRKVSLAPRRAIKSVTNSAKAVRESI